MKHYLESLLWMMSFTWVACGNDVKMVEVEPTNINFTKPSQSEKITAKAQDIRGAEIGGVGFTYRSEDPSVATVESDGTVKPAGNGNTAIVAETSTGVTGEAFVKVCLPKAIVCDPAEKLELKVGISAPIKCHAIDCKDKKIPGRLELTAADDKMLLKEGNDVFIGLAVGDTRVNIKSFGLETSVAVHVDEQTFLPGMAPGSGGGHHKGGGGGKGRNDPYSEGGGRFDHILNNMKFK
jgi:hypothetical protein